MDSWNDRYKDPMSREGFEGPLTEFKESKQFYIDENGNCRNCGGPYCPTSCDFCHRTYCLCQIKEHMVICAMKK